MNRQPQRRNGAYIRHQRVDVRGWGQQRFIQEIRATAADLREEIPGVSVPMVSRWENGKSEPSGRYWRLIDATFARTLDAETDSPEDDVLRREFLRNSASAAGLAVVTMASEPWEQLTSALSSRTRVDRVTVDNLDVMTATFGQMYQTMAPGLLLAPVAGHLRNLSQLLKRGSPTEQLRRRLASLAAETSVMLGWITHDQGDNNTAHNYYRSALTAAAEANDKPIGAYAIASASVLPAWRSSPTESVHLLTDAEVNGFSVDHASPTTRAWIYSLEAEAHTRANDERNALNALDNADHVLNSTDDAAGASPRVAFFDRNRLLGERGVTAVRLGRAADGRQVLEQVLDEVDVDQKIRSRLMTSLARAHIRHGNIDEGVEIALRSLDIAIQTATASSYDDVNKLRPELDPWAHTDLVQRLDEALQLR